MLLQEMELDAIDFASDVFRISEDIDSSMLSESLRAVGQLNPVILLGRSPRPIVICGFRRLNSMNRLGQTRVLARIIPENAFDSARLFQLALWDNLPNRQLNPLEKARVLSKLQKSFNVAGETLVRFYLPLLGLSPHEKVLRVYIRINDLHPGLRRCLVENRLTLTSLEMLAEMPEAAQERIAVLMDRIRLSASLQRKALDILIDLAAVGGGHPGTPLDEPEIAAVVDDTHLSPFQKGEEVYRLLYRRRNPRLSQAAEEFHKQKKALALPGSIRIEADPFFETPGIRVEFDAPDVRSLRDQVAALQKAVEMQAVEELFQL